MRLRGISIAACWCLTAHLADAEPAQTQRGAQYALPAALLGSAQALAGHDDLASTAWLAGMSTLSLPVLSAPNDASRALGLAGFVVGGGSQIASGLCQGNCRAVVLTAGLLGYSGIAATDIGWVAAREPRDSQANANVSSAPHWYGWRPLIGYGSLVGGLWLGTVNEAGVAGGGLALAGLGLEMVPLSHFGVRRYAHGWMALGGTFLGAGIGALAACANGCDSPYDRRSRAVFTPGRALLGATAGVATWAVIDSALLSYQGDSAERQPPSVQPFVTASPTTGRPRAGASFVF